jgi:hypothetical protein
VLLLGLEFWRDLELQPVQEFPDELGVEQGWRLMLERQPELPGAPPQVMQLLQAQWFVEDVHPKWVDALLSKQIVLLRHSALPGLRLLKVSQRVRRTLL